MTIIDLPTRPPPDFMVGPFTEYRVVIEGRAIPRLTARREGDKVWLVLDHRFGLECADDATAYRTAAFVANALAVGMGYSHLAAHNRDQPFAPEVVSDFWSPSPRRTQ